MSLSETHEGATEPGAPRVVAGGFLMGLANLVPGVSGGTMILAIGLYDRFISVVAELTTLRWSRRTWRFAVLLGLGLVVAVLGLSGPAVWLVTQHRWIAYSLFVGMTLGGVPTLVPLVRPFGPGVVVAVLAGFGGMAALAFGLQDTALPHTFLVFLFIGALGSSSMILPGISGSYILLVFGLYDVIVGRLRPSALMNETSDSLRVIVPFAIGVFLGIALLSNVLKFVLARFSRPAHGVLLGLLLGSVLGLWPFQRAVSPELVTREGVDAVVLVLEGSSPAEVAEATGIELTEAECQKLRTAHVGATKGELKLRGLELERHRPTGGQVVLALALLAGGFALTRLIGRRDDET